MHALSVEVADRWTGIAFFVGVAVVRFGVGVYKVILTVSCVAGIKDAIGDPWASVAAGLMSTAG